MKKNILVITGSRSEYGYLRPVLREMRKSKHLSVRLLVTGMHTQKRFGHTVNEIRKDMPVAHVVPIGEHDTMVEALAKEICGIEAYCMKKRPDMIMVIADRDEGFAGAIVAGHLGIPLVHLSGGDTTGFGVDEPIRHSISKFAHVHFPWTAENGQRLRALGEEAWRIHVTGSTSFDELRGARIPTRTELAKRYGLRDGSPWILLVQHPTPLDRTPVAKQLAPTIGALKRLNVQIIALYPNSDTGSEVFIRHIEKLRRHPNVVVHATLPHVEFMALLKRADVLVGNSSSGILESGYFHTPTVDIGGRQDGRPRGGNVIHVPYDEVAITRAIHRALSPAFIRKAKKEKHMYDRGNASAKIVRVLEQLRIDDSLLRKRPPLS